jgi:hypothetical protein
MRGENLNVPNRKAALAIRLAVLGTAIGTLAGFSGYALLPDQTPSASPAALDNGPDSQIPNRSVKADRLGADLIQTAATDGATYTLASATTGDERSQDRINALLAGIPLAVPASKARPDSQVQQADQGKADRAKPKFAALSPTTAEKVKKLPPPAASSGVLDDAQIAGIRSRLRLTADQAEYWPAVEEALREVARTQLRHRNPHVKMAIDTDAPEVQKLKWAAMPLLMRLSEDQKNEVRKLARVIGLEQVASQI